MHPRTMRGPAGGAAVSDTLRVPLHHPTPDITRAAMSDSIHAPAAPAPVGAYPHARRVGNLLFLSGIGPREPGSNRIPGNALDAAGHVTGHDITAQARQVFANVRAVLEAAGSRWEDLIDITVFLTDIARDFAAYNAVWAESFPDPATAPCRTTLGITALPTPIAIELKCIARVMGGSWGSRAAT